MRTLNLKQPSWITYAFLLPLDNLCPYVLWASLVAQTAKNAPAGQGPGIDPWVGKIPWRREWQLTPVFLPGEFHGQRNLVGYSTLGHKKSDTTERLTHTHTCTSYSKVSVGVGKTYILRKTLFFKLVICSVSKGFKI